MQAASFFIHAHGHSLETQVVIDQKPAAMIRGVQGQLRSAIHRGQYQGAAD